MRMKQKLIVGNWKMNGSLAANQALLRGVLDGLDGLRVNAAVCVPAVYVLQLQTILKDQGALKFGAQDVSMHEQGAFTGEISAEMLREFGVRYVIVGHSERRQYHAEQDLHVALKAQRALKAGITPIVCVGETLQERQAGLTDEVVKRQMAAVIHANGHCISEIVVAYEPVWAIGTGLTATPEEAQQVHAVLRHQLKAATAQADSISIVYGGSMNATNALTLLNQPDVDGGLIGGAALKVSDFLAIMAAASQFVTAF
jgi:triosephosphate isomerase